MGCHLRSRYGPDNGEHERNVPTYQSEDFNRIGPGSVIGWVVHYHITAQRTGLNKSSVLLLLRPVTFENTG